MDCLLNHSVTKPLHFGVIALSFSVAENGRCDRFKPFFVLASSAALSLRHGSLLRAHAHPSLLACLLPLLCWRRTAERPERRCRADSSSRSDAAIGAGDRRQIIQPCLHVGPTSFAFLFRDRHSAGADVASDALAAQAESALLGSSC